MNAQVLFGPHELLLRQKRGSLWKGFSDSKRGQLKIMAEILLFCCGKGKAKTRIMYAANINYPLLQKYTEMLTSRGLLIPEGRTYVTTEKGFAFLQLFTRIHDILSDKEAW